MLSCLEIGALGGLSLYYLPSACKHSFLSALVRVRARLTREASLLGVDTFYRRVFQSARYRTVSATRATGLQTPTSRRQRSAATSTGSDRFARAPTQRHGRPKTATMPFLQLQKMYVRIVRRAIIATLQLAEKARRISVAMSLSGLSPYRVYRSRSDRERLRLQSIGILYLLRPLSSVRLRA